MLEKFRQSSTTVHRPLPHDSAPLHVSGEASYVDDLPEPRELLHVALGLSTHAHASINSMDLSAVRSAPGVVEVLDSSSVPAKNDCSPTIGDDPVFAERTVEFAGQVLFAVLAESELQAHEACRLAKVEYEEKDAIVTTDCALSNESFILDPTHLSSGDAEVAVESAPHRLQGRLHTGGQDHFYLEGQVSMVLPREAGDLLVYSSTQHPSEIQHLISKVTGKPLHAITVEVRRMGGGFGGKESQAAQWACIAAIAACVTHRPAKLRLDRDTDMIATGKRHDFQFEFDVGFNDQGRIQGLVVEMASRCGYSADLSGPVNDRALLHIDNCYFLENLAATSHRCKTNTVSNTAFRGFGAPQAMLCIESILDRIASYLNKDAYQIRRINFYGRKTRNIAPYGMRVEDFPVRDLMQTLKKSSQYSIRRKQIRKWNHSQRVFRRGIAITPVKFGISFTMTHYNQASALVHVYTDGTIHLSHGGTEMGQGLFIKVAQVVAEEFSVPLNQIKIAETNTSRVPNTSATAASSGSDINGMAAKDAARKIKNRLIAVATQLYSVRANEVMFVNGQVIVGRHSISFAELVCIRTSSACSVNGYGVLRHSQNQLGSRFNDWTAILLFRLWSSCQ